ncbi:unnamed protein product [Closterium sp. Yama58-4]|nr:unnamed protein product [Closterium sp. Yama58-4]
MSTPVPSNHTQPSGPSTQHTNPSASTSEAQWLEEDSTHVVFKHFKVPIRPDTVGTIRVCKYCSKEFKGGAFRCAQHLAKWKGQRSRDVRLCAKVPADVRAAVAVHYEKKASNRDEKRRAEDAALNAVVGGAKRGRITDFIGDEAQCKKGEADYAVSLFFAGCRIPEHHADNPLWRNMVRAINNAPHGYLAPRRNYIGGAGLKQCRTSIEKGLQPIAASWKRDGVTVSSDLMTDRCGRPQANVMLVNDSGAVFVEAIDCNMESKTGGYIASLLRPIIEKVGPQNVVALCMDGGSNYGAACKELMADWPHIEYVPCATHVLDLLLEDVGKITWCKDIVDQCGDMITYVRNHHFTRNYLRSKKVKGGKGKQLVKPAGTRFGTNYIALSRLVELRSTLSQMVLSEEFANWSAGARKTTADTFRGQVMDDAWWKNAAYLAELLAIPFKVMRATDSSAKGMMGTIYDLMLQLTEDVNDKLEAGEKTLPRAVATDIGKIVRRRWDESLACALHVVGRILNPANQEEGIFRNDMECTRIFKAFIARHYDDKTFTNKDGEERRASLVLQEGLTAFLTLDGSFGLPEEIADREAVKAGKLSMVAWWGWHGTDHPHLASLACRALTQPVSASPCERGWASFESVHTARRNRLGSEKLRDLVYVTHNWRVVHKYHMLVESLAVLPGNMPEPALPEGYNKEEEEEEEEEGEEDEGVLADEYVK